MPEPKTNAKLNEICCEFAGLEQYRKNGPNEMLSLIHAKDLRNPIHKAEIDTARAEMEWPKVSTDWGATGRLSAALEAKHIRWTRSPIGEVSAFGRSVRTLHFTQGISPAGLEFPRALCLAVAALAEQLK